MAGFVGEIPHAVALAAMLSMTLYAMLLIVRLVTRRDWAALLVAVSILVLLFGGFLLAEHIGWQVLDLAIGIPAACLTVVLVAMRVGLVATMSATFVWIFVPKIPATLDTASLFAPQSILGMGLLVAIALYGLRYSIGGRSLLEGMLEDGS